MNGFWGIAGTLAFAGIAGSLHCIGMCGPILLSFSGAFARSSGDDRSRSLTLDFAAYHAGRIWTYGVLGFIAGRVGEGLRYSTAAFGWQRPAALALGAMVVLGGLLLLGFLPRLSRLFSTECGANGIGRWGWFQTLLHGKSRAARLLLGAVMGLLPCGMVWAMLPIVAMLPTPLHAAAGMVAFGLGTVPSLSAVLFFGRLWPARLRRHGTRLVGATLVLAGCFMVARTMLIDPPSTDDGGICRVPEVVRTTE